MQQRSLKAKYYAGMWDATGGSVKAGETEEQAAVREVEEELGIILDEAQLIKAWEYIAEWGHDYGLLITVFACRVEVPQEGFSFDKREVNDVKIFPYDVFVEKMLEHNDDAFVEELQKVEEML